MESYRGWNLRAGRLYSLNHKSDQPWESATQIAVCDHGCEAALCIEQHQCTCGIYSRKNLKHLLKEYPDMDIYGVVYNHGVVFEGQQGLRSEKVTIRALFTADIIQGKILARNYPGVAIVMPPVEVAEAQKARVSGDNWQQRWQKTRERIKALQEALIDAKEKYPGGFQEEKKRLASLLKGANKDKLIEFAKEYSSTDEWALKVNGGRVESRTRKAKAGEFVFEANDDTHPYIFIGSCRPNIQSSMRYMFDRNGVLVRRPNIRKWDEEPAFIEARKQAIEEWE